MRVRNFALTHEKTEMKLLSKLVMATVMLFAFSVANAAIISYDVFDAAGNCGPAGGPGGHGLWTNGFKPGGAGSCKQYFGQASGTFTEDTGAGTAGLVFRAVNGVGVTADVAMSFGARNDGPQAHKAGGNGYLPDWRFYNTITAGLVQFSTGQTFDLLDFAPSPYRLQVGIGADDKNAGVLGLSSWLMPSKFGQVIDKQYLIDQATREDLAFELTETHGYKYGTANTAIYNYAKYYQLG